MGKNIEKTTDGKIKLHVIIECDWADYDDVNAELILEDALTHFDHKDGVRIYLNPEAHNIS